MQRGAAAVLDERSGAERMGTIRHVNIVMEGFGGLLSLMLILSLLLGGHGEDGLNRRFVRILATNALLLLSDAAAWFFRGRMDPLSW